MILDGYDYGNTTVRKQVSTALCSPTKHKDVPHTEEITDYNPTIDAIKVNLSSLSRKEIQKS